MKNIFSPDSFLMKALTLFFDIMYLNALFIICSLPVFTIGASATALYSVLFKRIRGEEFKIGKTYFAEFKSNFKQATLFWIPYLLPVPRVHRAFPYCLRHGTRISADGTL